MQHAILAPSAAYRWVPCPGSVKMESQFPEVVDDDAENGNAAHWVAAEVLKSYLPNNTIKFPIDYIGLTAPNGIIITEEMAEAVHVYTSDILQTAQEYGLLSKLQIEKQIGGIGKERSSNGTHPDNWGTPDCWAYDENTKTIFIWDFKYGHRAISAFQNWQLMDYIFLILQVLGAITAIDDRNITVHMKIIQPRCYKNEGVIGEWVIMASELRQKRNILILAAEQAMDENPPTQTGEHCRDCRARHSCKGARLAAQAAMQYAASFPSALVEMSPQDAGIELDMLKAAADSIKFLLTGLEAKVLHDLKTGSNIPGWAIKMGLGNKKWIKTAQEIFSLGDLIGISFKQSDKPITPTQAINKGIDEKVINAYSDIPKTGLKLVKDDGTKAKKVFSK